MKEVNRVARGQVWSGVQARDRGLIDQEGGLQQAIDSAARIAGLGSDYQVKYSEAEISAFESFILDMTGSVLVRVGWPMQAMNWSRVPLLDDLFADLRFLVAANGKFTQAAHCLCSAP